MSDFMCWELLLFPPERPENPWSEMRVIGLAMAYGPPAFDEHPADLRTTSKCTHLARILRESLVCGFDVRYQCFQKPRLAHNSLRKPINRGNPRE